ncbi:hypothetical protein SAMN05443287_103602 [Micromonospora phaseoli]|uniref:Rho termination factor, N-terminal domain n=1 Tax=Micromonospora phaseoli TaxID=1144548 RepID=A0A1H6XRW3_9ACTN|nr:hypothetical protein [Micromonospora phaseoli]PZW02226.1 hypothetical protein CLV64_102600 [Micromonospora phaseoli]SEJ27600.1 hypothetical protein SAMN05443287_103602 [Micromonospora phaseoli]
MAQRNSSGRGGTATGTKRQSRNAGPNTARISESEISQMRVDDIRGQLRRYGVSGISALRKPELVKTLAKALRSGGAGRRSSGPAGRASATKTSGTRAGAARKSTTRAARKSTTGARKSAPRKATASTAARKSTAGTAARKSTAGAAPARRAAAPRGAAKAAPARSGGPSTGRSTSRSVRSSQVISSVQDRPERPGRSLVTTNHDVIRRWARERGAKPATINGTERDGRAGVLTFNIPGYRESSRVREITWDEWFHTFDLRRLNLIYQEQLRDGRQSNFFRTESPDREDG